MPSWAWPPGVGGRCIRTRLEAGLRKKGGLGPLPFSITIKAPIAHPIITDDFVPTVSCVEYIMANIAFRIVTIARGMVFRISH